MSPIDLQLSKLSLTTLLQITYHFGMDTQVYQVEICVISCTQVSSNSLIQSEMFVKRP